MDKYNKTGHMLRSRRIELNLSQKDIGDHVGVSRSAVSRWESGDIANIGVNRIKLLSEILKISPMKIVMGEEFVAEKEEDYIIEEDNSITELDKYFKENKEKLSSLSEEDSQKLIKLIDLYLD